MVADFDKDALERKELKAKIFSSYVSVVTGLLIPLVIAAATYFFNSTQLQLNQHNQEMVQRQSCIKDSLSVVDLMAHDDSVEATRREERRAQIATHGVLLAQVCAAVGIKLPEVVRTALFHTAQEAKSSSTSNAAQEALEITSKVLGSSQPEPPTARAEISPRIYFQISQEDQRPAARDLQSRLQRAKISNQSIVVPGIEKVATTDTALRCFKAAECPEAEQILLLINATLTAPKVKLQDLSAKFENAKYLRPRHYELWFAPGEIRLNN